MDGEKKRGRRGALAAVIAGLVLLLTLYVGACVPSPF